MDKGIEYLVSWRIVRVNHDANWPDNQLEAESDGAASFKTLEEAKAALGKLATPGPRKRSATLEGE